MNKKTFELNQLYYRKMISIVPNNKILDNKLFNLRLAQLELQLHDCVKNGTYEYYVKLNNDKIKLFNEFIKL